MSFTDTQVRQLKSSVRRRHVREREVEGKTLEEVFAWIVKESKLQFGQAILEGREPGKPTWIHLSLGAPFRTTNNQQALTFDGKSYAPWKG